MPVFIDAELRRIDQQEFGRIAYGVMECIFQLHGQLGRFFDEDFYRDVIASRLANARQEVKIEIAFGDFRKIYFMDLLVEEGAVFELKTVECLNKRHHAQLINYLLLAELHHGKLVNLRNDRVQHRFVNTTLPRLDRVQFEVDKCGWKIIHESHGELATWLEAAIRDWGTGLQRSLYEEAAIHFLGGEQTVAGKVAATFSKREHYLQPVLWAGGDSVLKISAVNQSGLENYEEHLRRFVNHTRTSALQWVNVGSKRLTFKTLFPCH